MSLECKNLQMTPPTGNKLTVHASTRWFSPKRWSRWSRGKNLWVWVTFEFTIPERSRTRRIARYPINTIKYPVYKVYMGLIIKGTIPRVPPISLWFLVGTFITPRSRINWSIFFGESRRVLGLDFGTDFPKESGALGEKTNPPVRCFLIHLKINLRLPDDDMILYLWATVCI